MSVHLLRLERAGKRLVTPELGRGEITRYSEEAYHGHVEPMARDVDLTGVDDAVDHVVTTTRPFEPGEIDPLIAPELHRALPLTRREASDPGVWRFLAVIHRPDFIRHRWAFRSWATIKSRFWNPGTRPDSNTFCRLWWVAELTVAGDDYELTRRVLATQSLANALFIRSLSHYRPAIEAAVEVLADKPSSVVEQVLLRLHRYLSIVPLEGLSRAQIGELLETWIPR